MAFSNDIRVDAIVATHEETQAMFAPVESNTLNHHGSDGVLVGATAEKSKISQLIPFQQSAWWMRSNNRLCGS